MNRKTIGVLGTVLCAGAACASVTIWNPTTEFSVDNGNPNGVWSYGWMPVGFGELTLYVNHGVFGGNPQWYGWNGDHTPAVWRNLQNSWMNGVAPGQLSLHPGPGTEPSVVRWTAPEGLNGPAQIVGRFFAGDGGAMRVGVRINGSLEWNAIDAGAFDLTWLIHSGDTIEFVVYGGYWYGNTPLEAEVRVGRECVVDFNGDGFVTGADFDMFVQAFESGDVLADFDGDGFITGINFDDFVQTFEAGC